MAKTTESFAPVLIAAVARMGGCTLRTLLTEAKKAGFALTRADILPIESDDELAMAPELAESLDMMPYVIPVAEGEEAKLRVFFVPKGTQFMTSDEESGDGEGDDADVDGDGDDDEDKPFVNDLLDLEGVEQFFLLAEDKTNPEAHALKADAFTNPDGALGAYLTACGEGRMAQVYAAVPIELRYEARRAFPIVAAKSSAQAALTGEDGEDEALAGGGEEGDADADDDTQG